MLVEALGLVFHCEFRGTYFWVVLPREFASMNLLGSDPFGNSSLQWPGGLCIVSQCFKHIFIIFLLLFGLRLLSFTSRYAQAFAKHGRWCNWDLLVIYSHRRRCPIFNAARFWNIKWNCPNTTWGKRCSRWRGGDEHASKRCTAMLVFPWGFAVKRERRSQ